MGIYIYIYLYYSNLLRNMIRDSGYPLGTLRYLSALYLRGNQPCIHQVFIGVDASIYVYINEIE